VDPTGSKCSLHASCGGLIWKAGPFHSAHGDLGCHANITLARSASPTGVIRRDQATWLANTAQIPGSDTWVLLKHISRWHAASHALLPTLLSNSPWCQLLRIDSDLSVPVAGQSSGPTTNSSMPTTDVTQPSGLPGFFTEQEEPLLPQAIPDEWIPFEWGFAGQVWKKWSQCMNDTDALHGIRVQRRLCRADKMGLPCPMLLRISTGSCPTIEVREKVGISQGVILALQAGNAWGGKAMVSPLLVPAGQDLHLALFLEKTMKFDLHGEEVLVTMLHPPFGPTMAVAPKLSISQLARVTTLKVPGHAVELTGMWRVSLQLAQAPHTKFASVPVFVYGDTSTVSAATLRELFYITLDTSATDPSCLATGGPLGGDTACSI